MSAGMGATRAKPAHSPQLAFAVRGSHLLAGDKPIESLFSRSGELPFYVYDSGVMSTIAGNLSSRLPPGISLHYAIKANPMPAVVEHMASLTRGLDVASAAELRVALNTGLAPLDISFAGPGKSAEDISSAVDAGVILVLESETEAWRVAELAQARGITSPVAIRVNPDFQLKSSGMKMGGGAQPFGIDAENVPALLAALRNTDLDVLGFHIFSGSQNLREDAIIEAQRETLALAARLAPGLAGSLRWLNIGGGLGVPYFPGEQPLNLEPIMAPLAEGLSAYSSILEGAEVVMELGRFLVAEAGIYACRVIDKKVSRGKTFLVTNGGLHHHLALSGNFGQVIRKNYPVAIANRMDSDNLETVSIVGPLCTPLDVLAQDMALPRAEIGDTVAVYVSGAYGFTASPRSFLSHPEPVELFV